MTKSKKLSGRRLGMPLRARIVRGVVTIEIGQRTLAWVNDHGPDNWSGEADTPIYRVDDAEEFAVDVVREMNDESEDGSTPLTRFIDEMCAKAIEEGSAAVERTDGEDDK